jgi:hypothetical protein
MLKMASFLVNQIVRRWTLSMMNGHLADSNHFESGLPLLSGEIKHLQKPSQ